MSILPMSATAAIPSGYLSSETSQVLAPAAAGLGPIGVTSNITGILRFLGGGATWTTFIDALKQEGLTKVLAEPTLITTSGRTANFLAGGEYPIPVPQGSGSGNTITIEYKTFGVGLNFTPTVLNNNKISMEVKPEVSELDFTNAVTISGYVVPSLTTRRVATTIELADGQSFAIAGLLKEDLREVVSKFPVLGDIPILGVLFRSTSYQKNETELVIIVTPHLVKPVDMAKQTLPTDAFVEPNDFEFYLLGSLEGRASRPNQKARLHRPDRTRAASKGISDTSHPSDDTRPLCKSVIPAKAGIHERQEKTGFRIEPGMTKRMGTEVSKSTIW